jgi:hypothetical protein
MRENTMFILFSSYCGEENTFNRKWPEENQSTENDWHREKVSYEMANVNDIS